MVMKALPFIVALLLFAPFVGSDFVASALGEYGQQISKWPGVGALAAAALGAAAVCFWFVRDGRSRPTGKLTGAGTAIAWFTFAAAVALQMLSWRLVGIASVTRSASWSISADPVLYTLSQVAAGKTLLVDLPSQYGLYPEILGPLFKLAGLSVFKVSALFAALQVVSLCAIYYVLSCLIKTRTLLVIAGIALVMMTFETDLHFSGLDERYYQYWPIRFFWPAVSVAAFFFFSRNRTLARGAVLSVLGATGLLWNLDSGLFIIVAYGAYLVSRLIAIMLMSRQGAAPAGPEPWSARTYLAALLLHVLITLSIVAAFLGYLLWKADRPLHLVWLVEYPRIFYSLGLMMLPLPHRIDPWMSVLCVYLLGLFRSLSAWRRSAPTVRDDVLFYLSILGLGLFVYYEGRSHVLNLVSVCWPAILVVAILADEVLRAVRARVLPMGYLWSPIASVALLLLAGSSFAVGVPRLFTEAVRQYATRRVPEDPVVQSELAFIKAHAERRRECLILSKRQGIYYAETGLASPVAGPGLIETLLKSDEERLVSTFLNGRISCVFLGVGTDADPGLGIPLPDVLASYGIYGQNPEGTMLYLQPKS